LPSSFCTPRACALEDVEAELYPGCSATGGGEWIYVPARRTLRWSLAFLASTTSVRPIPSRRRDRAGASRLRARVRSPCATRRSSQAAPQNTCAVTTAAPQIGYVTGLGKDARLAEALVVGGKPYAIGIDGRRVPASGGRCRIGTDLRQIVCTNIFLALRSACVRRCESCLARRSKSRRKAGGDRPCEGRQQCFRARNCSLEIDNENINRVRMCDNCQCTCGRLILDRVSISVRTILQLLLMKKEGGR